MQPRLTEQSLSAKDNRKVELQPGSPSSGLEFTLQRAQAKGIMLVTLNAAQNMRRQEKFTWNCR